MEKISEMVFNCNKFLSYDLDNVGDTFLIGKKSSIFAMYISLYYVRCFLCFLTAFTGFVGPGVCLIGLVTAKIPLTASARLTLAFGLKCFSNFGFLVNIQVQIFNSININFFRIFF